MIQDRYYEETKTDKRTRRLNGLYWSKNFIKRIIYYSLVHWQIRNEWVHDASKKENIKAKKKEVNTKIMKWYERKGEFDRDADYLFRLPLLGRYMKSMRNKESWLRTVELEYRCLKGD